MVEGLKTEDKRGQIPVLKEQRKELVEQKKALVADIRKLQADKQE